MKYAIKTNDKYGRFLSKTNTSKDGLYFVERENKNFNTVIFTSKKKWKTKVLCWIVNLYLKVLRYNIRCIVVDVE